MKGTEIFKWGLGLWLGYEILKEVNSSSQTSSNNLNPSPRNILTNLESAESLYRP